MKQDIYTNSLLSCNDVFADIANVNLMPEGVVIQADELEEVKTDGSYKDVEGKPHQLFRDCLKKVKQLGGCIGFLGYESQAKVNNVMPVRDMGYNYVTYQKQIQELVAENKESNNSAYVKVLHDNQKLLPVVTVVLYFGKEKWERPLTLRDMLDIPENQKEFWSENLNDHEIKVIHMQHQPKEIRKQYTSDYRVVAEYLDCFDQSAEEMMNRLRGETTPLMHPEQTLDLLHELSGDARFEMMKDYYMELEEEEKEEKNNVCTLLDAVENVGVERGISIGISQGETSAKQEVVLNMYRKAYSLQQIKEIVMLPIEQIKEIIADYKED